MENIKKATIAGIIVSTRLNPPNKFIFPIANGMANNNPAIFPIKFPTKPIPEILPRFSDEEKVLINGV